MQLYTNSVQDRYGNALKGAQITVRSAAGALATLYADNGVTLAVNPLTADATGEFRFYAANGRYTFTVTAQGLQAETVDAFELQDALELRASLIADAGVVVQAIKTSIDNRYRGALAADPATRTDGTPNQDGDEYFYTGLPAKLLKRWNGTIWQAGDLSTANLAASGGALLSGFQPTRTGSAVSTVDAELKRLSRRSFYLADYINGAGATAMFDALQRIAGEATTPSIEIDIGDESYTLNQMWTMPTTRNVAIHGRGSVNFAGGSLRRDVHDKYAALHGFSATGAFSAFSFLAAPSGTATKDYEIDGMKFAMNAGVWAVSLDGAREGSISKSQFRSGKGIYRTLSNICYIDKSLFLGLQHAIYDDGKDSAFSCGTTLRDSEILGCNQSIWISGCDDGEINGCTIDYNDEGIYLLGQDGLKIYGGYIGTRTAEAATTRIPLGGVGAGLVILGGAANAAIKSEKISVIGAHFTGHREVSSDYDNIYIETADRVTVADSTLSFYTRNAVRYGANVTYLDIHGNHTANRAGLGVNAFECVGADDSSNRIRENTLNPGQRIVAPFAGITANTGFRTENQGQAFAGAGATSFVFAHGLAYTPASGDISFSPMNVETAQKTPYLAGQDATNITVGLVGAAAVGTVSVSWAARRRRI